MAQRGLMSKAAAKRLMQRVRCAIYTRKSSEEGLEQNFNSLDAQREACEAFIVSQRGEGWEALPGRTLLHNSKFELIRSFLN